MSNEASVGVTAPHGDGQLMSEQEVAAHLGITVEQLRLMSSGQLPIPDEIRAAFPQQAAVVQMPVFRRDDVLGAADRVQAVKGRLDEVVSLVESRDERERARIAQAEAFRAERDRFLTSPAPVEPPVSDEVVELPARPAPAEDDSGHFRHLAEEQPASRKSWLAGLFGKRRGEAPETHLTPDEVADSVIYGDGRPGTPEPQTDPATSDEAAESRSYRVELDDAAASSHEPEVLDEPDATPVPQEPKAAPAAPGGLSVLNDVDDLDLPPTLLSRARLGSDTVEVESVTGPIDLGDGTKVAHGASLTSRLRRRSTDTEGTGRRDALKADREALRAEMAGQREADADDKGKDAARRAEQKKNRREEKLKLKQLRLEERAKARAEAEEALATTKLARESLHLPGVEQDENLTPEQRKQRAAEERRARKLDAEQTATRRQVLGLERKRAEIAQRERDREMRRVEKAELAAGKAAAKEATKQRFAKYKKDLAQWKLDAQAAKASGVEPPRKPKKPKNDTSKPKQLEIVNAVRAFATMLDNSPGELDSLQTMVIEYEGTQLGEAFRRIYTRMADRNATLVEAFAPERLFPASVHNMLAVGSKTISPGVALRTAVKLMESAGDAKRKLWGQIAEPLLVAVLTLATLFATSALIMPTFVEMYDTLKMPVPPFSAAIMVMSDITMVSLIVFSVLGVGYAVWWFAFGRRWDTWRTILDRYSVAMPLLGKANQAQATFQLLRVLNSYLSVGSPEREALVDTADATSNRAIKKHLVTTSELMMVGRKTFADVLDNELFPNLGRYILATGQRAGRVLEAIRDLEGVYEREAEVEQQQAIRRITAVVSGFSALIFMFVMCMVSIPPLEMFGAVLSYGS